MSLNNTASANSRAVTLPDYYLTRMDWSTDNEDIATVDSNGNLTFKKTGMVLVTVKATIFARGYILELIGTRYELGYVPAENNNIFEFETDIDIDDFDVKEKALQKMNEYYANKAEVRAVVDGNNPDCNTCIFAFEGLGSGFGGISTEHPSEYKYLSAMMVVTEGKKIKYITRKASTLPDNRPDKYSNSAYHIYCKNDPDYTTKYEACTTLEDGIYDYYSGYHRNSYAALKPKFNSEVTTWKGWYLNDKENCFHSDECSGINIHASGQNPQSDKDLANSLGCQTVYVTDYYEFGKAVGFLDKSLTLTPPTSNLSTNLPTHIGKSSPYKKDVEVKYILDRTYDEKNKHYNKNQISGFEKYYNGVFYPIKDTHVCITEGNFKCKKC